LFIFAENEDERDQLVTYLMDRSEVTILGERNIIRKLPKGTIKEAQNIFGMHRNTISSIWNKAKNNFREKGIMRSVSAIKQNSGRKKLYDRNAVKEAISEQC